MNASDPLGVRDQVPLGSTAATVYRLDRLDGVDRAAFDRRPRTIRILLENLLRHYDSKQTEVATLRALANGTKLSSETEIPFYPGRVLLQDFTGLPVLVDLTTLRSAAAARGLPPGRVNPIVPVDLVVDHSVQVDSYGSVRSLAVNLDREYERNSERYQFLRWSKGAYQNLRIVPPGNGIVHQVNLEHLAQVVTLHGANGNSIAYPDTLIGTDSHSTMVNGVSVLGWGVGGIEAEAVMLGEPYFLAPPEVVGVELSGSLPEGATATDLVLTVTRALRKKGVVDKFVEFTGPGVAHLTVPDRATISNMCPEYGATSAMFPIDEATLAYLTGTGRDPHLVRRVEAYARLQGLWGTRPVGELKFDDVLHIDLGSIVPTVSGPKNPEESVGLSEAPTSFRSALAAYRKSHPRTTETRQQDYPSDDLLQPFNGPRPPVPSGQLPSGVPVQDGAVVIAAITSCTNTSNPSVMIGAGLIARRAWELGLKVPPYVKTSLAPGSKVVTAYLEKAGLLAPLADLGFDIVGYGCTTCIGNSGPLPPAVAASIVNDDTFVAAVLSGNRNFEARIHNLVRANYLMSPMLVVAYALAGRMDIDLTREPLGKAKDGRAIYLKDLWPRAEEIRHLVEQNLDASMYRDKYRAIEVGDEHWEALQVPPGELYPWDPQSTYIQEAPYLHLPLPWLPQHGVLIQKARVLGVFGDQISTDHISPAGEIPADTPAGQFLAAHGVAAAEFNTYGSRRGDHDVMIRGTFANVRIKNQLVAPREGGFTIHVPSGTTGTIFEIAERYRAEGTPLLVLAGRNYGQGSSRDWAAKGPRLLGVGAVIAESYERIHRSNLIDMGVLPLQFRPGEGWRQLDLTGRETYRLALAPDSELGPNVPVHVVAMIDGESTPKTFTVDCRLHSAIELEYYRGGGVLPFVMERRFGR
ncbi:MAG: aconitate hydratase AcnA [Thermoplasmata archaeon]